MQRKRVRGWALIVGLILIAGGCDEAPPKAESLPARSDATARDDPTSDEVECLAALPMIDPCGLVLLPVAIQGEEHLFLLDTGATHHVFDSSLCGWLGRPVHEGEGVTSANPIRAQAFRSPELRVAGLSLDSEQVVACADLEILRLATGHDVRGVLGVPFLEKHRVRLDWDRGKVFLLDETVIPDKTWGIEVKVQVDPFEGPLITADVGGRKNVGLLVDTGMDGTLGLERFLFDSLEEEGELRRTGSQLLGTAGGVVERFKGRLRGFCLASWPHQHLIASQSEANKIGLRYLRRFCVTFDLAHQRIYLHPSRQHDQYDRDDISGLRLVRCAGQVVVYQVAPDSPAQRAGILSGVVITGIDGEDATELMMSQIREILRSEPGRQVKIECVDATGVRNEVTLALEEEPWQVTRGPQDHGR